MSSFEHGEAKRPPVSGAQERSEPAAVPRDAEFPLKASAATILQLQRLAGNGAIGQLLAEQEQTSPVVDVIGTSDGRPLDPGARADMEGLLGAEFSDVKIHTGPKAAASAAALQARAYTVGNEIVFGEGAYAPGTADGQHTLAHELTHVVQQRQGPVSGRDTGTGVAISDPSDSFEQEAESKAAQVIREATAVADEDEVGPGNSSVSTGIARGSGLQLQRLAGDAAVPQSLPGT